MALSTGRSNRERFCIWPKNELFVWFLFNSPAKMAIEVIYRTNLMAAIGIRDFFFNMAHTDS